MSLFEICKVLAPFISAISSSIAAYCAWNAIKENKKNVFLHQRFLLAVAVNDLYYELVQQGYKFKISDYQEIRRTLLKSKYYTSDVLYKEFIKAIGMFEDLEANKTNSEKEELAKELKNLIEELLPKTRLDQ
ncbi:hypothetical protein [Pseudoalteromonas sp. T1lg24]|uniref:hypothetical protein n=1 Tax=Pseudoalteromonas sp. T1lg24 TaxID=2077099 RepID=UPI000CF67C09|nr:hypothetical protein [Pseudoalteromonas sp. T1lg24]